MIVTVSQKAKAIMTKFNQWRYDQNLQNYKMNNNYNFNQIVPHLIKIFVSEATSNRKLYLQIFAKGVHDCAREAFCYDKKIGYGCICNDGYEGDGFTCSFVDMCIVSLN